MKLSYHSAYVKLPCRRAGVDGAEAVRLVQARNEPEVKQELAAATDAAVQAGAFGLPLIVLEGNGVPRDCRLWFGTDRLEQLACVLGRPWLGCQAPVSKL